MRRPFLGLGNGCSNFTIRRTVENSLRPLALASYPGSGNTWVRYLIETATGVYTGSIYKDVDLYFQGKIIFFSIFKLPSIQHLSILSKKIIIIKFLGFWGELAEWNSGVTIVQKTHDAGPQHIATFDSGAILVLRNPYDAVLSFHNFIYGGHTGFAPSNNYQRPGIN